MADDREPTQDEVLHDLAVANNCGERPAAAPPADRPPGRHHRESYDDLDTQPEPGTREDDPAAAPVEPPARS